MQVLFHHQMLSKFILLGSYTLSFSTFRLASMQSTHGRYLSVIVDQVIWLFVEMMCNIPDKSAYVLYMYSALE